MVPQRFVVLLVIALIPVIPSTLVIPRSARAEPQSDAKPSNPLILAHYMPWFTAKPQRQSWGWHWTMNHFDPDSTDGDQRQIAAEYYPLIGPYDSGDATTLEYHLLQMKLAGVDGVIVDWYGLEEFRDYAVLHENTKKLVQQVMRLQMKFVICYEDQTIAALVQENRISANDRVAHASGEIQWLAKHWMTLSHYVKLDEKPILLSFGNTGLSNEEWTQCVDALSFPIAYFSEHSRRDAAVGAFDWPIPSQGIQATERFAQQSQSWTSSIPVAFPRFVDIYQKANVGDGYGRIEDDDGRTFQTTLRRALSSDSPITQIATWNDWGEGTQVEPSIEFGYRDLEVIQELRRKTFDPTFTANPSDLSMPHRLLKLRRSGNHNPQQLDLIADDIASFRLTLAREKLGELEFPD